jgi:enoyl-CoA hydratase
MHRDLARLPRDADADPEVKVLVITGAGRAFCAGGDMGGFSENGPEHPVPVSQEGRQIVDHLLDCEKPVISAIHGYAMGFGATLALLPDIVVAAESTVIADTHVSMGLSAGDGGQVIWPLLMGVNRAKYFLMTGDRLTAPEAERLGLVNFVVPDDEYLKRALEIADRLAAGPARAISASKVPINKYIKFVSNMVLPLSLQLEIGGGGSGGTSETEEHRAQFQKTKGD